MSHPGPIGPLVTKISVFERMVSDSFDPYQAWRYLGPDLGPDCLQRISSDTLRQIVTYPIRLEVKILVSGIF